MSPLWLRGCALGVLGVVFGVLASWISGEVAVSWFYLVIDVAQVVGAGVMTIVLVSVWRRRRTVRAS